MKSNRAYLSVIFSSFVFFFLFIIVKTAYSADVSVICNNAGCDGANTLFNETNLLEGDSLTRTLSITNNIGESVGIYLGIKEKENYKDLSDKISIVIYSGSDIIYSNHLTSFLNEDNIFLGEMTSGATRDYEFEINTLKDWGNDLQNKRLSFDMQLDFVGTTSTGTEDSDSEGNSGNNVLGTSTDTNPEERSGIIGNVLGLSDTSSVQSLFYFLAGSLLVFIGLRITLKRSE